jgi:hypothetical protein
VSICVITCGGDRRRSVLPAYCSRRVSFTVAPAGRLVKWPAGASRPFLFVLADLGWSVTEVCRQLRLISLPSSRWQNYVVNPHIGQTVGLSQLVTLLCVSIVGVLFGGLAVILAVPFTSAVATLIDVLVLGHDPPAAQARQPARLRRTV